MKINTEDVDIKKLTKSDLSTFIQLIDLFNKTFHNEIHDFGNDAYLTSIINKNDFVAIVAILENEVIGGLTAYELPMYYSKYSEILLYDLAVKEQYQRLGIGKRLLLSLKDYCKTNGIKEFFVLASEEDQHAIAFYHSTGGRSEKVVNFIYGTD
jgi:aminoglycoside 3-N-acetyltransferase I